MTPKQPYLLRAMHEWMSDNALTPHIIVDATRAGVRVPQQFVADGKIVLNISLQATRSLNLGNDAVLFQARFGGQSQDVYVPVDAVLGIYARENGQGLIFGPDDGGDGPSGGPGPQDPGPQDPRPQPDGEGGAPDGDGPRPERAPPRLKVVK